MTGSHKDKDMADYIKAKLKEKPNRMPEAIQAYIRHFNVNVELQDLAIGLPVDASGLTPELVPRALKRLGLVGRVRPTKGLRREALPVCIFMKDGSFRIVHSITGDIFNIESPSEYEGNRDVESREIVENFSGNVLVVAKELETIKQKYSPQIDKNHWFWSQFKYQKGLIFNIVLATLIANILAVSVSLFTLQVYDRVLPNQSIPTLWVLVVGVFLAVIMEGLLRVCRAALLDISGRNIEIDVSTQLFQNYIGMRLTKRPGNPSSLIYNMREFSNIREFFTNTSVSTVADIPFVVIFLGLIYMIAGNVAFVIVVAMIAIILPSMIAQKKMSRLSDEMLGGSKAANKVLMETAYGLETIKSLRAESHFQGQWEDLLVLITEKTTAQRLLSARLSYWSQAIQQSAYILAITAGAYLVFAGNMTLGGIIAISILTTRTLAPISNLSNALARWQQVRSALVGLDIIATSEQEKSATEHLISAHSLAGEYALDGVTYSYDEDSGTILTINNLKLEAGSKTALLGANGSGKSTLLMLLSGLHDATTGKIFLDGMNLRQLMPEDVRRHIGYLPQQTRLFSGTLRENLTLGKTMSSDSDLFKALEFSGLDTFVRGHPRGLDMLICDGGVGVSIGQKESVGLARLYLQDPTIVILDEPTASFDQMLELKVVENLKSWLHGKTCILSTHRPAALQLVDEVIVLKNGSIALKEPTQSVIDRFSVA